MKKILLTTSIIFLIFQIVVLAVAIDMGSPAINRVDHVDNRTIINKSNPASASGVITSVEIYANQNLTDCEVATFYVVSGDNLSTRDHVYIGAVTAFSIQTFDVILDVEEGDYIGLWTSGRIEADLEGVGIWCSDLGVNYIPCTNQTFNSFGSWQISLRGIGESCDFTMGQKPEESVMSWSAYSTRVMKMYPTDLTGVITKVFLLAHTDMTGVEVASFYVVSGNNLSTRDWEAIGNVTAGTRQSFDVDIDVEAGDYLGIYYSGGALYGDNLQSEDKLWVYGDDYIPCTNQTFWNGVDFYGYLALYAIGTIPVGWAHKWNTKEISKWDTKEIMKWNDLE